MTRQLILLIMLALPLSLTAQESAESQDEAQPEQTDETPSEARTEGQPEPGSLRKREISEAFERFKPSEEISADNAVPFPTDI